MRSGPAACADLRPRSEMVLSLSLPIIEAKLRPPLADEAIAPPATQLERLDDRALVTLVVAPAGFGKSTLLGAWTARSSLPVAWLSLDRLDDDPVSFLSHLIAALRTLAPDACRATRSLAHPRGAAAAPWPALARSLVRDVEAMDSPVLLVLDDYHALRNPTCQLFVQELVRHHPAHMRLAISSRAEPDLPLARLRADGALTVLRADDLLWSPRASAAYLVRASRGRVDWPTAERVAADCDGWITALCLAAAQLAAGEDWSAIGGSWRGPSGGLPGLERLWVSVLERQAPERRTLLESASILDSFNAALLAELALHLDDPEARASLADGMLGEDLFLIPLSGTEEGAETWYRFHDLFRELLGHRLLERSSAEERARLHRRAAGWFERQGAIEEALRHYLAAGDERALVTLVESHRHRAMDREEWARHDRWLRLLPRAVKDRHPELLLAESWSLLNRFAWEDLPGRLARARELLERGEPGERASGLLGEVEALEGQLRFRARDLRAALPAASRALQLLPVEHASERGVARACLAAGLFASGKSVESLGVLFDGLKEDRDLASGNPTVVLMALAFIHWMSADLASLLHTAEQLISLGSLRSLPSAQGWGHYFRGSVRYARDDLSGARGDFRLVADHRVESAGAAFPQSLLGLAHCALAEGDLVAARELSERLAGHAEDLANRELLAEARIARALVSVRAGEPTEAARLISTELASPPMQHLHTLDVPLLTLLRVLLGLPSAQRPASFGPLLGALLSVAEQTHNRRLQLEAHALCAALRAEQGRLRDAREPLATALELAKPSGWLRPFVELPPSIDPLLDSLAREEGLSAFVAELQSRREAGTRAGGREEAASISAARRAEDLRRTLSFREMDVLTQICLRKSNREIASELGISPETVKRHASSLYRKLGVHNRRQAAALAAKSGLVTDLGASDGA